MKEFNSFPLTRYAATVANTLGLPAPEKADPAIDWVVEALKCLSKGGFDRLFIQNPDAVGMWLWQKYPDAFAPVLKNTQVTIPFASPMPTVTPVCFGTMYTGVLPAVHGIEKYEKKLIPVDTLFDVLLRAGKKIAMVTTESSSMANIFKDRAIDFYHIRPEGEIVTKSQELICRDEYDVIITYTYRVDYDNHRVGIGPNDPRVVNAIYNQAVYFDELVSTIRRFWKKHNTLVAFSPDHGMHEQDETHEQRGSHGLNIPQDVNILHYLGVVRGSEAPGFEDYI